MTSQSTSPEKLDELIGCRNSTWFFQHTSGTADGRGATVPVPRPGVWRPYEAFVYVHDKYIDQQREAGLEINHPEIVRLASTTSSPDLLSVPPRTAREALLENWHRYAQCVAWTCADIVRNFTNDHLITSD
ncbi:hypothetical protein PGTUg99_000546 [Puccinia graminis f. sp. tritici]|uniref:Uncharacterized protein n=1 Tax=Puccinia graminis f. sp. tritici TaxID=56615 RepID=A0A5B0LHM7_PUCGR|nr:hypothetical protein PGTUg99_000546 [Puccinia graminis f. sp. tritici]